MSGLLHTDEIATQNGCPTMVAGTGDVGSVIRSPDPNRERITMQANQGGVSHTDLICNIRAALEASRRKHLLVVQRAIAAGYPADELRHDEDASAAAVGQLIHVCSVVSVRAPMVMACGDLEVYSDDPRDLSAMPHDALLASYRAIIAAAATRLRPDRFACFVVRDFRCRRGFYRNFTRETVAAFEAAGLRYYNEAILVTMVGSLPIRVGRQFDASRKLGKTHQNVLVFVKGDPKRATAAFGSVQALA